jgi:hypothetical protein
MRSRSRVVGAVPDLSAFQVGEQVAIRGESLSGVLRASEMRSIYREVSGTIRDDLGVQLETSAGLLGFPAHVRQRLGVGGLDRGATFHAEVWIDPTSGERLITSLTPYARTIAPWRRVTTVGTMSRPAGYTKRQWYCCTPSGQMFGCGECTTGNSCWEPTWACSYGYNRGVIC